MASAAVAALPEGTVAHRLGDYVFTYEGMDLNNAVPRLWVVVEIHDPSANAGEPPQTTLRCGQADGTIVNIPTGSFPSYLNTQNMLRRQNRLPPLPDLMTISYAPPPASGPAEAPGQTE